jgi:hypothetical protein
VPARFVVAFHEKPRAQKIRAVRIAGIRTALSRCIQLPLTANLCWDSIVESLGQRQCGAKALAKRNYFFFFFLVAFFLGAAFLAAAFFFFLATVRPPKKVSARSVSVTS